MEHNSNLKELEEKLIERAELVRDEYIKMKDELSISIRKDILRAELKDILCEHTNYYSLKNALEDYISKLEVKTNDDTK